MNADDPGRDVLEAIVKREDVLTALDDGGVRKRELADDLPVSRTTVDRAIRELEGRGLVEREDDRYGLTITGRLALDTYLDCLGTLETVRRASPLMAFVPPDAPLSPEIFDGASVSLATPIDPESGGPSPEELVDRIVARVDEADRGFGFTPVEPNPRILNRVAERGVAGDLDGTILLSPELTEYLLENQDRQLVRMLESGGIELFEASGLPYGLAVYETRDGRVVQLIIYGDTARVRGLVENDTGAALEWAREVFERYRRDATPLGSDA